MSAARTLGGWLPVDMMPSIFANASSWRRRIGVSRAPRAAPATSFSGVQSCWRYSGTTFSPTTRFARMTELTCDQRRMIQRLRRRRPGRRRPSARRRCASSSVTVPGFGERRARDPERRPLFLLADHDPGRDLPALAPPRRPPPANAAWSEGSARTPRPRPRAASSVSPNTAMWCRISLRRLPGSTSSTGGASSRRLPLVGIGPQASRSARSGDGRHSCRAGRAAGDMPPARTAAAPGRDRHRRASRAPGPAAMPRPRARRSRRSGSRDRAPGRAAPPGG